MYDNFSSHENNVVQNSIVVTQNNGKKCTKKCAAHANFVFLLIRSIDFDAIIIAVPF